SCGRAGSCSPASSRSARAGTAHPFRPRAPTSTGPSRAVSRWCGRGPRAAPPSGAGSSSGSSRPAGSDRVDRPCGSVLGLGTFPSPSENSSLNEEAPMKFPRMQSLLTALAALALLAVPAAPAAAQGQTIKIGTLYDHSGPFSAAGSLNCWRGAKMMIDYINEKGGVLGKYKIVQVDGDSQSKAEVAINEAERLLNVEKVDILAGVYSSAHAVPIAERVDKQKKFLWITTAIADAVLKDRNLQYTFRPQANGGMFGENSVKYVAHFAQEKLKKAP